MADNVCEITNVSHQYGKHETLSGLSLCVRKREFVAVVGPSGCGKTTLLNLVAGAVVPSSGQVHTFGATKTVHQAGGLFPWRTAAQNVELALRDTSDGPSRSQRITELLDLVGLSKFANHYPHELSGGMRQRVEIVRALAGEGELLLLDEPFSALDYLIRLRMRAELTRLLSLTPRAVILVTHDIEEAAQLADRIIVLSGAPGRIRAEVEVNSPRPRDVTDPEVVATVHELLSVLTNGDTASLELER